MTLRFSWVFFCLVISGPSSQASESQTAVQPDRPIPVSGSSGLTGKKPVPRWYTKVDLAVGLVSRSENLALGGTEMSGAYALPRIRLLSEYHFGQAGLAGPGGHFSLYGRLEGQSVYTGKDPKVGQEVSVGLGLSRKNWLKRPPFLLAGFVELAFDLQKLYTLRTTEAGYAGPRSLRSNHFVYLLIGTEIKTAWFSSWQMFKLKFGPTLSGYAYFPSGVSAMPARQMLYSFEVQNGLGKKVYLTATFSSSSGATTDISLKSQQVSVGAGIRF